MKMFAEDRNIRTVSKNENNRFLIGNTASDEIIKNENSGAEQVKITCEKTIITFNYSKNALVEGEEHPEDKNSMKIPTAGEIRGVPHEHQNIEMSNSDETSTIMHNVDQPAMKFFRMAIVNKEVGIKIPGEKADTASTYEEYELNDLNVTDAFGNTHDELFNYNRLDTVSSYEECDFKNIHAVNIHEYDFEETKRPPSECRHGTCSGLTEYNNKFNKLHPSMYLHENVYESIETFSSNITSFNGPSSGFGNSGSSCSSISSSDSNGSRSNSIPTIKRHASSARKTRNQKLAKRLTEFSERRKAAQIYAKKQRLNDFDKYQLICYVKVMCLLITCIVLLAVVTKKVIGTVKDDPIRRWNDTMPPRELWWDMVELDHKMRNREEILANLTKYQNTGSRLSNQGRLDE